jgi:hypothetical protein
VTSRTTEITFAPAEPIGTRSAPMSSARPSTNAGGRVRLTAIRGRSPVRGGTAGGEPVLNVVARPGCATAPATRSPPFSDLAHSATCTAQSSRGGSENSRVPSRGSMIHTRAAESRAVFAMLSALSSDSTASSGRCRAHSSISSRCAARSPASLSSRPSSPCPRTSVSRSPARVAAQAAKAWSSSRASAGGTGRFDVSVTGRGYRLNWLWVFSSPWVSSDSTASAAWSTWNGRIFRSIEE